MMFFSLALVLTCQGATHTVTMLHMQIFNIIALPATGKATVLSAYGFTPPARY